MLFDDVCVDGRLWDMHLLRVYITETAYPQILGIVALRPSFGVERVGIQGSLALADATMPSEFLDMSRSWSLFAGNVCAVFVAR